MKRFFAVLVIVAIVGIESASAWGLLGHEVIIEIAKRHITPKTKANIAKYIAYDITKDALYMDDHRHDKEIAYSTAWHGYSVDENLEYDMNPRLGKGDVLLALKVVDHNFSKMERLTDSAVVSNIRWLIHFAGDIHCPSHSYIPGPKLTWACEVNGTKFDTYHTFYDEIPSLIHPNKSSAEVAAQLDNASKAEIKKIQSGYITEWAKEIATYNSTLLSFNKPYTKVLESNTVERSSELVNLQMRNAGYRLAYLLNKYLGK